MSAAITESRSKKGDCIALHCSNVEDSFLLLIFKLVSYCSCLTCLRLYLSSQKTKEYFHNHRFLNVMTGSLLGRAECGREHVCSVAWHGMAPDFCNLHEHTDLFF